LQLFAQKRTGDALPQQVQAVIETGKALVQEAKGGAERWQPGRRGDRHVSPTVLAKPAP
jgi:hypothetical protein